MNSTTAAVLALAAVGYFYMRSRSTTATAAVIEPGSARNDAASPRLPSMPAMPDMPKMPGMPPMPSGATPNAPRIEPAVIREATRAPQPADFLGGGLWG